MKARGPWIGVVFLAALAATALESLLLQRMYSSFTGGFLNPVYLHGAQVPAFLLSSLWVDAAAATIFVAPALWAAARVPGINRARRLLVAVSCCLAPLVVALCLRFSVHDYVGDAVQYRLGTTVAPWLLGVVLVGAATLLAFGLCDLLLRFVPDGAVRFLWAGTRRRGWAWGLALVLLTPVLLALIGRVSIDVQFQLHRKATGRLFVTAADRLTDFDGDRYGLVWQPIDPRPFDENLYPFAVDWPANGVDENGIGGDLAAAGDFADERYEDVKFRHRPDVLLVVLETFRADNIGAKVDGRPVTPVLNGLVEQGALRGEAYSHNGYTVESLTHLFTGAVTMTASDSLIDDFSRNGYLTACVSGEDESFGSIERITGMVRADYFVDARRDIDERTNPSTSAGSLTVPAGVVVRNVERFLAEHGDEARPLFLYVNFQDAHFPYVHRATERLVGSDLAARAELVKGNREAVRRTYLNGAANSDKALGRILEAFTDRRGVPAIVVVGDHGESLYDGDVLGHGVRINGHQTRIPFLASGMSIAADFPLGLADVRRTIRDALARPEGVARGRVDRDRWVFQFVGSIRSPAQIGAASAGGGMVYDFRTHSYSAWGRPSARPELAELITRWEQIVLRRARSKH